MGLKDLHLKLKAFRLRRLLIGNGNKKRGTNRAKLPWMMPISHGYHVMEDHAFKGGLDDSDSDSVLVQREQIEELELWLFGIFDAQIGDGVNKYLQSHLFDRFTKESQIRRKSKEMMRKAYLGARARIRETQQKSDEKWKMGGSASVMVINREKLVMANMGDYRVVVCRDGVAHQMKGSNRHQTGRRHWSRSLFYGRMLSWNPRGATGNKQWRGSDLVIGTERIDANTEFVIIASTGIWDAMKNQEAVNLIWHLDDPQEAAECLAKEALTRMSKSNISCVVIRFD